MEISLDANNSGATCLVCMGKKLHYDFSLGKFRVEECADCGLMRLNPQPTDSELAEIYGNNYFVLSEREEDIKHVSFLKSRTADYYLDLLESYTNGPLKGRLLEIGCGHGDFLARAEARGLNVTGLEYSAHACGVAEGKISDQGKIICGEIDHLCDSDEKFDYIIFADVLEHVRYPRDFLNIVHGLLAENGVVGVAVPCLDSTLAKIMKNKWMEFKPEHLWYYSKNTLSRLLYTEGFGELSTRSAKKTLSMDYIAQHFKRYPIQPFTAALKLMSAVLPKFIARRPVRVVAGGIITFARREAIRQVKKLSIIIPAYNEGSTIRGVLDRVLAKRIRNLDIEVIVVESGSTDGTRDIVQEYAEKGLVKLVKQAQPKGKGYAIREGFKSITGDFVLIQDADDEYDIEDYDVLIEPLMSGEAAFVLGARHGGGAWKMRQFTDQRVAAHLLNVGHWFFTSAVNWIFGLRLKDPFTMYKVFRADCLRGLTFECKRFDFDFELLIKLALRGYIPIEIPVNYRSRSFKEGKKVRVFRDPLTWLAVITRLKFNRK